MNDKTYLKLREIQAQMNLLTAEGDNEINHQRADELLHSALHYIGCEQKDESKEQSVISMILSHYNCIGKWHS